MDKESTSIAVHFSQDELTFLSWAMEFLVGGVSDVEEDQRAQMEFKAKRFLSELDEGILRVNDRGMIHINCGFCGGTGAFPSDEVPLYDFFGSCPVCDGKGINSFQTTRENLMKCRFCEGNGMEWDENFYATGEECHVCSGTGYVLLESIQPHSKHEPVWEFIHPQIASVSKSRFLSGHFADSVEAAFKDINKIIKNIVISEIGEELDGASLMYRAFSPNEPIIRFGDLSTESGRNVQQGYMQIYAGAMIGIRNPKAHDNLEIAEAEAIHLLTLASLLMHKLDGLSE